MSSTHTSWLRRHPALALIGINLTIFVVAVMIAEVVMRLYIPYNPGYYMSVDGNAQEVVYPYGIIKINSHGFPDDEFDMTKSLNVGYFGDSVTYGVGAGHGYRFSDLLAESYPEYEHMNFSGIGLTISDTTIKRNVEIAERFELDVAVYMFNLNDIVPDAAVAPMPTTSSASVPLTRSLKRFAFQNLDQLRGKSYLYTWIRTLAKNYLEAQGIGFHGYLAYELHPHRERAVLAETAGRIDQFRRELSMKGVDFILVLLPYEMQISYQAADTYEGHGISWEKGFLEGSTQRIMIDVLDPKIRYIDLYAAFVDTQHPERSSAENRVGEFFVYDRGDKLDWNHPNRSGHRVIADYLTRIDMLGRYESPEATDVNRFDRGR